MIRTALTYILIFTTHYSWGQIDTTMKAKDAFGLKFYILSEGEKLQLLDSLNGKLIDLGAAYTGPQEEVYLLDDGRIIFEMIYIEIFLFNSIDDYKLYVDKATQLSFDDAYSAVSSFKDSKFIEKTSLYITLFSSDTDLKLDFRNIETIGQIDSIVSNKGEEFYTKYKLCLVAIIGEYIINNCPNSGWMIFEVKTDLKYPVVLVNGGGGVISPFHILDDQLKGRIRQGKPTNLQHMIQDYINHYK